MGQEDQAAHHAGIPVATYTNIPNMWEYELLKEIGLNIKESN